jgi:spore maturation protein A
MIHYIWMFLLLSGVVAAASKGQIDLVTEATLSGAKDAITVCFGLISILVFWLGMMQIAQDAGLIKKLAKLLGPIARFLFPSIPADHPAMGYILSNMSANLFGLGSAATPMGLKAMEELQKLNPDKQTATPAMCTLLAINTSGLTLIPTTVIGLRLKYDSINPTEIIGPTMIATFIATSMAIIIDRYYQRKYKRKG